MKNFWYNVGIYWKAILAFVAPAAGQLVFAVQDSSAGGSTITQAEWIAAILTALASSGLVVAKGNNPQQNDPNANDANKVGDAPAA